ncbi:MAG: GntR family transcriptional regulator [Pseudomonadota bacterium]
MGQSTPKYLAVYKDLRRMIEGGRYPVGSRLPSEGQLTIGFSVSRITVRHALEKLVTEGFVDRRQGSGYTIVSQSPPQHNCLSSFTDAVFKTGKTPTSRLVALTKLNGGEGRGAHLPALLRNEPELLCIERLRCVDQRPVMLVRTVLPLRLARSAEPKDFPEEGPEQSMLRILKQRFGLDWAWASEEIGSLAAPKHVAALLEIEQDKPILNQACIAYDEDETIVFYEELFRTGKVSFELRPTRREVLPVEPVQWVAG